MTLKIQTAFCSVSAMAIMATLPGIAQAQSQDSDNVSDERTLDKVIVTSTLREADVQDIPVAVTAIAPEQLDRQGVFDIKNLGQISSSFFLNSTQTETQGTTIRIRGVGTTGNNIGLESSVGVFIDGVYQSRPGVALGDFLDVERVEVLRGPQGTLFGRNTSAGALNVKTTTADLDEFGGYANFTYGNYNQVNVQGALNIPIEEGKTAFRIAGTYRARDGFADSLVTGQESFDRDRYMIRGQIYSEPTSDLSIRLLADVISTDEQCCQPTIFRDTELVALGAFSAYGLPADGGVPRSGLDALDDLETTSQTFLNNQDQIGFSAEVKWNLDFAELTYIGSYRDFEAESSQDPDFTGLDIISSGVQGSAATPETLPHTNDIALTTHELRLQGNAFDNRLDWLFGAYYSDEEIEELYNLNLGADYQRAVSTLIFPTLAALGDPLSLGDNPIGTATLIGSGTFVDADGAFANNAFRQDGESFSIFTHNVFSINDQWDFTIGARYVDESKDGSFNQVSGSNPACQAIIDGVFNGNFEAAGLGAFGPTLVALQCFPFAVPVDLTVPGQPGVNANTLLPLPVEFAGTFEDDALTYTTQLSFRPNDDLMFYGSYSRGFKSGGFNLDSTAAVGGADPRFRSEKVDAFELGLKSELFDQRLTANFALFHLDLEDFQILEFTGIQFNTFNVPSAESTGFEVELNGRFTDSWSGNLAYTYADANFPDDCADGAPANEVPTVSRLCGFPMINSPENTIVAGLTFEDDFGDTGWTVLANVNATFQDDRRTLTVPREAGANFDIVAIAAIQESTTKLNARIGLTSPDENYTIEVWGTNITDERTIGSSFNTPLRGGATARSRGGYPEEPRFYGVTLRTRF